MRSLFAPVFFAGLCFGQSVTGGGTIQGTVKDASGAVVAHAKVGCRHLDTGELINSETNSDGFFTTPPVRIGKYKVRVQAPGMKAWEGDLESVRGARFATRLPIVHRAPLPLKQVSSSGCLPIVIVQHPAQPLAPPDGSPIPGVGFLGSN
jgi:hypothetical protein